MMRIDSHQHFWKYNLTDYVWMSEVHEVLKRDFLPQDLQPLLQAANIQGTIAVQARQFLAENEFLLELAEQNNFIKGVVGWIPLCDPRVEQYLERYVDQKKIVGFRHVVHDEPDNNFILRSDFNKGVKALSRYAWCYDVLIFEHHLPQAIEFVDKHPNLTMIVDHIAKPVIKGKEFDHAWAKNIRSLAERENVVCKLSGMVTEVRDHDWNTAVLKPYFETVLEAFGANRLLFGSDWPVCILKSNYSTWVHSVQSMIQSLTLTEQQSIMGGNTARIYLD